MTEETKPKEPRHTPPTNYTIKDYRDRDVSSFELKEEAVVSCQLLAVQKKADYHVVDSAGEMVFFMKGKRP